MTIAIDRSTAENAGNTPADGWVITMWELLRTFPPPTGMSAVYANGFRSVVVGVVVLLVGGRVVVVVDVTVRPEGDVELPPLEDAANMRVANMVVTLPAAAVAIKPMASKTRRLLLCGPELGQVSA